MNPSDSEQNDNNDPQAERPVATFSPTSEPSSDSAPSVNEAEPSNDTPTNPFGTEGTSNQPAATLPVKKSKKGLVIGLIAAGTVLVLGAAAAGLAMWWTSPQKALDDAVAQSLKNFEHGSIRGDISLDSEAGSTAKLTIDGKYADKQTYSDVDLNVDMGMLNAKFTGSFATDSSKNSYFKINDVKKTVDSMYGEMASLLPVEYHNVIEKIDGRWVKATEQDLKDMSKDQSDGEDSQATVCVATAAEKYLADGSALKEAVDAYNSHKFMAIKKVVGSEKINGRDSHRLEINIEDDKAKAFGEKLKQTAFFKEIEKCGKSSEELPESGSTKSEDVPVVELWVDKWSHRINKISMKSESNTQAMTMAFTLGYDKPIVTIPTAETNFSDLKSDIDKIIQQMQEDAQETYSYLGDDYDYGYEAQPPVVRGMSY